jgi:hypothetical protein
LAAFQAYVEEHDIETKANRNNVYLWRTGKCFPHTPNRIVLAGVLELDPEDLFYDNGLLTCEEAEDRFAMRFWFEDIGMRYDVFDIRSAGVRMNCTGLKDKNGKLVFEKDILSDGTNIGEVIWHDGSVNFGLTHPDGLSQCKLPKLDFFSVRDLEVIGNAYENLELKIALHV